MTTVSSNAVIRNIQGPQERRRASLGQYKAICRLRLGEPSQHV